MMTKFKGLGKGLDVLFASAQLNTDTVLHKDNIVVNLDINAIVAGQYQPRKNFDIDEIQELADSITTNGVLQPILVRKVQNNKYEIIAGERRFRASKVANKTTIPAIIKEYTNQEALAIALIENIQRKDLNIVEEALGYKRLISEFDLTHENLAGITAKSRSNISNILRILNLDQYVLDLLSENLLDMGHARALLSLDPSMQIKLADKIIAEDLTTAEVEKLVNRLKQGDDPQDKVIRVIKKDINIAKLESDLSDKLAMNVLIKHKKNGSGKLELVYQNLDELDNFLQVINFKKDS